MPLMSRASQESMRLRQKVPCEISIFEGAALISGVLCLLVIIMIIEEWFPSKLFLFYIKIEIYFCLFFSYKVDFCPRNT